MGFCARVVTILVVLFLLTPASRAVASPDDSSLRPLLCKGELSLALSPEVRMPMAVPFSTPPYAYAGHVSHVTYLAFSDPVDAPFVSPPPPARRSEQSVAKPEAAPGLERSAMFCSSLGRMLFSGSNPVGIEVGCDHFNQMAEGSRTWLFFGLSVGRMQWRETIRTWIFGGNLGLRIDIAPPISLELGGTVDMEFPDYSPEQDGRPGIYAGPSAGFTAELGHMAHVRAVCGLGFGTNLYDKTHSLPWCAIGGGANTSVH